MKEKMILFDLDGTLTDSGEGIMNCAEFTLRHFGLPIPERQALREFVGPPLDEMFVKFGIPSDQTDEAICVYRSRYTTLGKFENTPYAGIREMLEKLQGLGYLLYVATSKPEQVSVEILEKFELAQYFEEICGASLDHSRTSKEAVIDYLLKRVGASCQTVMVGDTVYDVLGAKVHGIPTIGVAWGYGSVTDMKQAGAVAISDTPEQLLFMLQEA